MFQFYNAINNYKRQVEHPHFHYLQELVSLLFRGISAIELLQSDFSVPKNSLYPAISGKLSSSSRVFPIVMQICTVVCCYTADLVRY